MPLISPLMPVTTNSSWLPRGRVAMPLISRLMPVPHLLLVYHHQLDDHLIYIRSLLYLHQTIALM